MTASWGPRELGDGMGGFGAFLREELFPRFPSGSLHRRSDAAVVDMAGHDWAMTCDAFLVDPLFFPGGDIGKLAVCGTANDLLTEGARPRWLLMSLVVAESADASTITRVLDSVRDQAGASGAELVGGDTKSVRAKGLELMLTITGGGPVERVGGRLGFDQIKVDDRILVTGPVGGHAIAVLSAREGLGFGGVRSDCADMGMSLWPLVRTADGLRALRDATRGGVLAVLHEMVETRGVDALVNVDAIPVDREVAMACEMLGLDALELANEGCMILFVDPNGCDDLLARLRTEFGFARANVIGSVVEPRVGGGRVLLDAGGRVTTAVQSVGVGVPRLC